MFVSFTLAMVLLIAVPQIVTEKCCSHDSFLSAVFLIVLKKKPENQNDSSTIVQLTITAVLSYHDYDAVIM